MGIDLVHDEVEKELLTVSVEGKRFGNGKSVDADTNVSLNVRLKPLTSKFIVPGKGSFSCFFCM